MTLSLARQQSLTPHSSRNCYIPFCMALSFNKPHAVSVKLIPGILPKSALAAGIQKSLIMMTAWMAELGRQSGRSTSLAKAQAARDNGKRGGRPRKTSSSSESEVPDLRGLRRIAGTEKVAQEGQKNKYHKNSRGKGANQ